MFSSTSVGPLVGARQRRHAARRVEVEWTARAAGVQLGVQGVQLRGDEGPVVERRLQGRGDAVGDVGGFQVARDHDQLAVARFVVEGGKFHGRYSNAAPRSSECAEQAQADHVLVVVVVDHALAVAREVLSISLDVASQRKRPAELHSPAVRREVATQ